MRKGDELRRIHHGACSLNKSADSRGARVRPLKRFEVKSLPFDKLRWYRDNSPSDFCQGAFLFDGKGEGMKCKFKSTGRFEVSIYLSGIIAWFFFVIGLVEHEVKVYFVVIPIAFFVWIALMVTQDGIIRANENEVIISHKLMKKNILVSRIAYDEIDYADYKIKATHNRIGFTGYVLTLSLKKKNGKVVNLITKLGISENMPIEKPDEYKKFLANCPMVKLCKYINKRANGRFADET